MQRWWRFPSQKMSSFSFYSQFPFTMSCYTQHELGFVYYSVMLLFVCVCVCVCHFMCNSVYVCLHTCAFMVIYRQPNVALSSFFEKPKVLQLWWLAVAIYLMLMLCLSQRIWTGFRNDGYLEWVCAHTKFNRGIASFAIYHNLQYTVVVVTPVVHVEVGWG